MESRGDMGSLQTPSIEGSVTHPPGKPQLFTVPSAYVAENQRLVILVPWLLNPSVGKVGLARDACRMLSGAVSSAAVVRILQLIHFSTGPVLLHIDGPSIFDPFCSQYHLTSLDVLFALNRSWQNHPSEPSDHK